jgi:transitional endoplasmic reticulum ATPase
MSDDFHDVRPNNRQDSQFRVAEALSKDVDRGLVRLDPQDLERLGVRIGDVVEITGKRSTVARAMPAYAAQRGQSLIQMDGIVRTNAGAGLDERVTVRQVQTEPARTVVLMPLENIQSMRGTAQSHYLARRLDGLPVVSGDQVRINLFGTRAQNFTVLETTPVGPVLIGPTSIIQLSSKDGVPKQSTITYEDVGGLRREIRRIREMIELPLRYPEVFERLGIDPPKGVLLHGPPGTGKTLIARAVAHETSAHFIHLNGPEIIDKWYGASEAQLRNLFEEASKKAPSIIFIDEIDAIAPKREELGGDRQVERRVVAQLLALMDGLESRGNVIVVGATNIPNTLDPALRRPGRFDREIAIGAPDRAGRLEIMEIHTRGMPLAENVLLEQLAAITHGFVGADLAALCREAAMSALRRLMPDIDFAQAHIPYEKLMTLEVTMDDFTNALAEVEPSAIREVFTEIPEVSWDDVGGLENVKRLLIEAIEWPLRYGPLFDHAGVRPPKGILLHGAPGTGKTLLAKALARACEVNFIAVRGPQLISMWVGESERGVREVFRKARQAAPCIIFFDEIDALVPRRGGGSDNQVAERVVSQFLTELDGIEDLKGVVVLAATNRKDRLDPALLRPGRFDFLVELPVPDRESRLAILYIHTRHMPLGEELNLEVLTDATEGYTGADLEGLCHRTVLLAIREFLAMEPDQPVGEQGEILEAALARFKINQQHFERALQGRD